MSDSLNRFLRDERRRRLKEAGIKPKKFDSRLPMKQPKRIELTYKAALQRYQIETDKEERDRILVLLPFLLTPAKAEETSGFFGDLKLEISAILLSQLPKIIQKRASQRWLLTLKRLIIPSTIYSDSTRR